MKILIVDDDRLTRRMLGSFLRSAGYEVLEAGDGAEAFTIACEQRIRFVITDWMMPNVNGLELVRHLRSLADSHFVYVILLTAKENTTELVEAMNAGADDFIRKPFDQDELRVRVRAGQRIIDLTERLEQQAMTDPLTGLLNRRGLHDALARQHPQRNCFDGSGIGFVVADLDHFKQINDRLGHGVGDLVLQQSAGLLRRTFEPEGLVARIGGEEFWIVLCGCSAAELAEAAERARRAIEITAFDTDDGGSTRLTISLGCTHLPALGNRRLEDVFQIADAAVYRAKTSGRNRVVFDAAPHGDADR